MLDGTIVKRGPISLISHCWSHCGFAVSPKQMGEHLQIKLILTFGTVFSVLQIAPTCIN